MFQIRIQKIQVTERCKWCPRLLAFSTKLFRVGFHVSWHYESAKEVELTNKEPKNKTSCLKRICQQMNISLKNFKIISAFWTWAQGFLKKIFLPCSREKL